MMKVNKMFFCLTMAVALVLGNIGCSRSDDNEPVISPTIEEPTTEEDTTKVDTMIVECYTAEVLMNPDPSTLLPDMIQLGIIEEPTGVTDEQPRKNATISVSKYDFPNPNMQSGDVVDFKITECSTVPKVPILEAIFLYSMYTCKVVPCE